jgi:predicted nucleotidyltransferase
VYVWREAHDRRGSIIDIVNDLLRRREDEIVVLCKRHHVRRLSVFGSATRESFDPRRSDVDFLVEFDRMSPRERADHFFGLQEDLEAVLGVPVDLVEPGPIRNPYFRQAVEASGVLLFEAA